MRQLLDQGRTLVMGIINVTPDSVSDGGDYASTERAVARGFDLIEQGADLIDIGGESTRPGAQRVDARGELRRVVPVIRELASGGAVISVDTMRAEVARAAVDAGATWLNDVSGGLADPAMVAFAAESGLPFIAMHWRGHGADMQSRAVYDDVVADVVRELAERRDALLAAGIAPDALVLDPGLGFAKTAEHNWEVLRGIDDLTALGHRLLLGASRKGFLGKVGRAEGDERAPKDRDGATAVITAYAVQHRLWGVRVHDVVAAVDAVDVAEQLWGSERHE